jgi:hypothetical protein
MRPRAPSTLDDQLRRQFGYLERSAEIFDQGYDDEAQRLATTLRVLLHTTKVSHSLLDQLGIKNTLNFVDTGLYRDRLDAAMHAWVQKQFPGEGYAIAGISPGEAGLVVAGLNIDGLPAWVAPLSESRVHPTHPAYGALLSTQPFDPWWTTPLVEGSNFRKFSRKNLILIMANQDGGSHVDPGLDADYEQLTVDSLGKQWAVGPTRDVAYSDLQNYEGNVASASVRQIAYEVIGTLGPLVSG